MRSDAEIFELCDRIREISFALHRYLRHGHLEKVYENGYRIACVRPEKRSSSSVHYKYSMKMARS